MRTYLVICDIFFDNHFDLQMQEAGECLRQCIRYKYPMYAREAAK